MTPFEYWTHPDRTDEEIRIKVAELEGMSPLEIAADKDLPNYPQDLNAVHELENALGAEQVIYGEHLDWIAQKTKPDQRWKWNATARQRCIAYILTKEGTK